MQPLQRISIDPDVMGGKPCIRGMRVTVGMIVEALSAGRSVADLVREGVDLYLRSQKRPSRDEQVRRALAACGKFASGKKDISARHDDYLAKTIRD